MRKRSDEALPSPCAATRNNPCRAQRAAAWHSASASGNSRPTAGAVAAQPKSSRNNSTPRLSSSASRRDISGSGAMKPAKPRRAGRPPMPRAMQSMRQAMTSSAVRQPPTLQASATASRQRRKARNSSVCSGSGTSMRHARCRFAASIAASAMPSRSNNSEAAKASCAMACSHRLRSCAHDRKVPGTLAGGISPRSSADALRCSSHMAGVELCSACQLTAPRATCSSP